MADETDEYPEIRLEGRREVGAAWREVTQSPAFLSFIELIGEDNHAEHLAQIYVRVKILKSSYMVGAIPASAAPDGDWVVEQLDEILALIRDGKG